MRVEKVFKGYTPNRRSDLAVLGKQRFGNASHRPQRIGRSSYTGRRVDALGPGADEGRGVRRDAPGSGEHAGIRGCPNAATPPPLWEEIPRKREGNRGN